MIEVRNLTKMYGSVAAIRDVSFEVGKGEILGFLGPNGAGKTTTMRILTGYFPATSGTAKVAGFDVMDQLDQVRKRIGYLPENVPLYTDMSVKAYIKLAAEMKGLGGRDKKRAVEKVISDVGLSHMQNRLIKKLSKGYRQRVGLAQALVNDPEVLILDEPTVGLDPKQITDIRSLIKGLSGDRTVILSTHILPEVHMTCQKVTIINRGRIVASDSIQNLTQTDPTKSEVLVTLRDAQKKGESVLRGVGGVLEVSEEPFQSDAHDLRRYKVGLPKDDMLQPEIARAVVGAGLDLIEITSRQASLEEVFIHHISREETARETEVEEIPPATPLPKNNNGGGAAKEEVRS
jgi:ABC-2 type transport system ATP-binding protein